MDLPKKLPNRYNQEYLKEELEKISIYEINEQRLNELSIRFHNEEGGNGIFRNLDGSVL